MKYNWNSTKKTKKKNFLEFILQDITPEITKMWEIAILGGTLGAWEPMWNSVAFYDFVNFLRFQPLSFG